MAGKHHGPNRGHNVAVSVSLARVVRKLDHLCGTNESSRYIHESGAVLPGSSSIEPGRVGYSADQFAVDYLFANLLSKYDDGKPSKEKEKATWDRFYEAEKLCLNTNRMFRSQERFQYYSTSSTGVWSLMESASRKVASMLGPFSWDEASQGFAWGPGASTRLPRRKSHAAHKFSGKPEATIGNAALAAAAIAAVPLWKESVRSDGEALDVQIVKGNRIVTVPKNYKTDRTIAIEPCMNMYVQKGIGSMIRRRLRLYGCDLNSQVRNQRLARVGSMAGSLATIDLSMASDTVAYELVRFMMPPDWFEALEQCRSPVGVLPSGEEIRYQKFSSMGNGYTFELESLIFYALALSVVEAYGIEDTRVAVYGDDIIVPTLAAEPLLQLLAVCGFKPNNDKTFSAGPFRESCGKHYFSGNDVTPFFVRRPTERLSDLFLLHNNLYRWLRQISWSSIDREAFRPLVNELRSMAPRNWRRPRIPDGMGDGAFIGTFEEALPRVARRGWEGYTADVLVEDTLHKDISCVGGLIASLHRLETTCASTITKGEAGFPIARRFVQRKLHIPQYAQLDLAA